MFPITLSNLIIFAVLSGLGLLFVLWLVTDWRRRYHENRATRDLCLCRLCGSTFHDTGEGELADCPQCGAWNEHERFHQI